MSFPDGKPHKGCHYGSRSTAIYSLCGGDEQIAQNGHVCDEPIARERLELLAASGAAICVRWLHIKQEIVVLKARSVGLNDHG